MYFLFFFLHLFNENNKKLNNMSDQEFYTQLVQYSQQLEGHAYKLTSNKEESKDLIQETVYKALRNKSKFQVNTNLSAWLYTIMKNTYINQYKRNKRVEEENEYVRDRYFSKESFRNHSSPISHMQHKHLKRMINELDQIYKVPFKRYFAGFKYKEIAEELNIPIGTVKNRIFQAPRTAQGKAGHGRCELCCLKQQISS